jgi:hypothetical protein
MHECRSLAAGEVAAPTVFAERRIDLPLATKV